MKTYIYMGCVSIPALILGHDFILICVVGIMHLFSKPRIDSRQCPWSWDCLDILKVMNLFLYTEIEFRKNLIPFHLMRIYSLVVQRKAIFWTKFGRFSRSCTSVALELCICKRDISEISMNRELSRNVAKEYFTF